jgi:hypothetical protein
MRGYSQGRAGLSASLRCAAGFATRAGLSASLRCADFLRGGRTQRPRAAKGVAVFFRAQPFTNEFATVSRKKNRHLRVGSLCPEQESNLHYLAITRF